MPGQAAQAFSRRLGGRPDFVVRAPGRVNLIGEHTDYNDGLVLPMAIDLELQLAARRRGDRRVRLLSENAAEAVDFAL
ncbi:MAG: galactokinase family protein, partial [Chloroflexota bacterium]|nr:galactokinase family protein [Chloroflexota bacterium]